MINKPTVPPTSPSKDRYDELSKAEKLFLKNYIKRVSRVWAEYYALRGSYGAMSMKIREELLAVYRNRLHEINKKLYR